MYRESNLGLLIKLDATAAARQISDAFVEFNLYDQTTAGRAMELVAKRLAISPNSLKRYLAQLQAKGIAVHRVLKAEPVQQVKTPVKKRVAKKKTTR